MSDLQQLFDYRIANGIAPDTDGPRAVSYLVPVPAAGEILVDLTSAQMRDVISGVQTIFVDNSAFATALTIICGIGRQRLVIPPNAQAYLPILLGDTGQLSFSRVGAAGDTRVQFLNVQVPSIVWKVT